MSETLIIPLEGRIDSNNAGEFEENTRGVIAQNPGKDIVFDASKLEYISSAGLRVLMKIRKETGQEVTVKDVFVEVYEIFEVTGFTEILNVEKRIRELSVDGCEVIGRGFFGTVYRVNEDTIVKVYNTPEAPKMIKNEQGMARAAFVAGIPTAISFDMVKVGENYGSVFEMLNAKTYNELVIESPEKSEEIIDSYVDFIKTVHETDIEDGKLPLAKDNFSKYLDFVKEYLKDGQYEKLAQFLETVPDENHMVHGDFHMKNVMLSEGEPMLIDMDTISKGHPYFDIAGIYVSYQLFKEDEPDNTENFMGIPASTADLIWNTIMNRYFDDKDEGEKKKILRDIRVLANVRFLYIVTSTELKEGELGKKRIDHSISHLEELLA